MLETQIEVSRNRGLAQAQGQAALICLPGERFGTVSPFWRDRSRTAELETLQRWFRRAIAASDLPSVLQ